MATPRNTTTNDTVSVRELYQLIDSVKKEIMNSINRVEGKFDTMEAGRLTTLEREVANMQGRLMMVPIIISIGVSVFFFVMNYVLFQGGGPK